MSYLLLAVVDLSLLPSKLLDMTAMNIEIAFLFKLTFLDLCHYGGLGLLLSIRVHHSVFH
jgi:hypothetical protein